MRVALLKETGISIKQQIKEQVRYLIDTGVLPINEKIPSARTLADSLNVNRNTVSLVYHELEQEGYLTCSPGRGTLIKGRIKPLQNISKVKDILKRALKEAKILGFSEEEFLKIAYAEARYLSGSAKTAPKILVVECNPYAGGLIEKALKEKVGKLNVELILLNALKVKERLPEYLAKFQLVVTEFSHLHECKNLINGYSKVMAVMISSRFKFLNELEALPKGTKVCQICYTEASIKDAARMLMVVDNGRADFIKVALSTKEKLREAIKTSDVLMVSEFAYEQVKKMAGKSKKIVKFEMAVEEPGLKLIKMHLQKEKGA